MTATPSNAISTAGRNNTTTFSPGITRISFLPLAPKRAITRHTKLEQSGRLRIYSPTRSSPPLLSCRWVYTAHLLSFKTDSIESDWYPALVRGALYAQGWRAHVSEVYCGGSSEEECAANDSYGWSFASAMIWGDEVSLLFTNDALSFDVYFSFFSGFFPRTKTKKRRFSCCDLYRYIVQALNG